MGTNISIFTTKWGHYSIAAAVEESIKDEASYNVHLNNLPIDRLSELTYIPAYKFFPALYRIQYKSAEYEEISKIVLMYLDRRYKKIITKHIVSQKPKVVINTYFGFNKTLEALSQKYDFLYINIVADPRTFHKLEITSVGYNFVFDQKAKKQCLSYGADKNKIIISGWFVRNKFNTGNSNKLLRDKLGLSNNVFTILVVGGSAGNYSVLKILPALIKLNMKIQVVFICGEGKTLLQTVKAISEIISTDRLQIHNIGFTKNLHEYIFASDLVVGKAGPNLLFETVGAKKPFIAVSHIHGQEDGNIQIINENKLGYTEENQIKIFQLVRKVVKDPSLLDKFKEPVEIMAKYNQKAGKILDDFIKSKI